MAKKKHGNKLDGWINLHKPAGITSTQALGIVKRALKPLKAGHAGTLDPLASGILPIALGEATKTVPYVQDSLKIYNFEVTWGEQRTTDDGEGTAMQTSPLRPARAEIEKILPAFIGDVTQIPPQFSAVKIDGARAYDLARDGEVMDLKSRQVYIERLEMLPPLTLLQEQEQSTAFTCLCGKGTYIRSLARDMGQTLGCFGYISRLERAKVGPFTLENAISLDIFGEGMPNLTPNDVLLPLQTALDDIPVLALKDQEAAQVRNGNGLSLLTRGDMERLSRAGIELQAGMAITALATHDGKPVALVEIADAALNPVRLFNV